jgi:integrase/recombinase XerD
VYYEQVVDLGVESDACKQKRGDEMASSAVQKAPPERAERMRGAFITGKQEKGMEWDDALNLFLRSRKLGTFGARRQVRERTLKEYEWDLGKFIGYIQGEKKITHYNQMTRRDVNDFLAWLDRSTWAKASKNKYLKSLKAFFNWVDLDPDCEAQKMQGFVRDIPKIPKNKPRMYIPTPEEMLKFMNAFDQKVRWGMRDFTVMTVLLDTGARIGEVCFMKESHLKLDAGMILIPEEGKTGERLVPIDPIETVPVLKKWLRERERFAKCDRLFLNRFGGPCTPHTFDQAFRYLREETGLGISEHGNLSPHCVRHFFCTHYLVNGGTLHNLQRITGHKSLETLMIYVHLANQMSTVTEEHSRVSPLKNLSVKGTAAKKKRKVV